MRIKNYLEDIIKRGYHPVGLWSKRNQQIFDANITVRNHVEQLFAGKADFIVDCDSYEETYELAKRVNPKIILPGAELGVELAARLVFCRNVDISVTFLPCIWNLRADKHYVSKEERG